MSAGRPMRIRITDERRELLLHAIQRYFRGEFDEQLSDFKAGQLLDFFVKELGAPVYNQAIQDARSFLQKKLDDMEGEFYEPEDRPAP